MVMVVMVVMAVMFPGHSRPTPGPVPANSAREGDNRPRRPGDGQGVGREWAGNGPGMAGNPGGMLIMLFCTKQEIQPYVASSPNNFISFNFLF